MVFWRSLCKRDHQRGGQEWVCWDPGPCAVTAVWPEAWLGLLCKPSWRQSLGLLSFQLRSPQAAVLPSFSFFQHRVTICRRSNLPTVLTLGTWLESPWDYSLCYWTSSLFNVCNLFYLAWTWLCGWEDSSAGNTIGTQAWGPDFTSPKPCENNWAEVATCNSVMRVKDRCNNNNNNLKLVSSRPQ